MHVGHTQKKPQNLVNNIIHVVRHSQNLQIVTHARTTVGTQIIGNV